MSLRRRMVPFFYPDMYVQRPTLCSTPIKRRARTQQPPRVGILHTSSTYHAASVLYAVPTAVALLAPCSVVPLLFLAVAIPLLHRSAELYRVPDDVSVAFFIPL